MFRDRVNKAFARYLEEASYLFYERTTSTVQGQGLIAAIEGGAVDISSRDEVMERLPTEFGYITCFESTQGDRDMDPDLRREVIAA